VTDQIDVVVIGAGVIGLAVGRAMARAGRNVVVVEKNRTIGAETSSRNSEVIHAGLYYRPEGLRARLCVAGKEMLYEFCARYGVNHARCGKLVVAFDADEEARLAAIAANARASGVADVVRLDGGAARGLEPALACRAALHSPSTGIIDSHGLILALRGAIEDCGGSVVVDSPVLGGEAESGGLRLRIGGDPETQVLARTVINCAGLHADKVARSVQGLEARFVPDVRYAKGRYFMVAGAAPFSRLIYPMPTPDSLGVHFTRDLGGQAKLGPDIEWDCERGDYSVDEALRKRFWEGARRFWPDLAEDRLRPGYAGLRPKIVGPGEEGDFRIDGPVVHGVKGLVNLFGFESPGLTACLAIGEEVRRVAADAQ
jgi:D-amino-acid oxidase